MNSPGRLAITRSTIWTLVLGLLVALPLATTSTPATAAPVTGFDPGNIISDAIMYDSSTMNASSIQSFLDVKGAACSPGTGNTCIKSYRESTPSRAADALCTGAYSGASNESAATIIAKVSVACKINPQVLLVTLQKEQGLITATAGKSAATYSRALGFGCPDNSGGWCNPQYAGFANQVCSAAKQFKRYASNPNGYSYRAGRTNTILWHPTTGCGSTQVYIQNQATAGLYNYTPYVPNSAALAAGYGTGDSCSSYGNRNFHLYFQAWFGTLTNRAPIGVIDEVVSPAGAGTVRVRGWALDPDSSASISVHIYVDGVATRAVTASGSRTDVGRIYGLGDAHGFDTSIPAATGAHSVCAYSIDSAGGPNTLLGCATATVSNQTPHGSVDSVSPTPGTLQIRGWALDPDTSASIDVHVYVDGRNVKIAKATGPRPDVGRIFGRGDAHGFDITVPATAGPHTVCVYAIDTTGGPNPALGCRTVSVVNKPPLGSLDVVTSPRPGQVMVRGWTFDPDTAAPIAIHVYVDGRSTAAATANTSRPDVARVHGAGANHGFETTLPIRSGQHTVCVYALDATGGPNPQIGCKTVTVANSVPTGAVESAAGLPAAAGGPDVAARRAAVSVTGWAWDFDSDAPVDVTLLVDGQVTSTSKASKDHPSAVGTSRSTIGYSLSAAADPGAHTVCVRASDPADSIVVELGCMQVTVPDTAATGHVDVVAGGSKTIRVVGWAQDLDTVSSIAVHVRVDGAIAAAPLANVPRPDVDRAFGNGQLHGFDATFPAAAGTRNVCVYAIGWPAGDNPTIRCQSVVVQE